MIQYSYDHMTEVGNAMYNIQL